MRLLAHLRSNKRTRAELATARHDLAEIQQRYRSGRFSGHPEEMLSEIDHRQRAYDKLVRVMTEGRVLDWDAIDEAHQARLELSEHFRSIPFADMPESYWPETNAAQKRVDDAWARDLAAEPSSKAQAA